MIIKYKKRSKFRIYFREIIISNFILTNIFHKNYKYNLNLCKIKTYNRNFL